MGKEVLPDPLNVNQQIGDVDAPGGAGNVSGSTPRITLATDDLAIAAAIEALRDKYSQHFNAGLIRHVGASLTSGLASTQSFRLANPAASGKNLLVLQTLLTPTVDATFTLSKNGTLAGPTNHTPWNPIIDGGDTTVAVAQSQAVAFTGATSLPGGLRTAANITLSLPLLVLLTPGKSIGASVTYGTGATSHVNIIYVELPE
ncbi:MAG: hypothetical protein CMN85_10910 [Spongiibacteraceae bacterium]|uniref:hypothetical protein n=1 Tax=uncultured Haliea sp. TaxID=622616 RepID=UPI000C4207D5|nr:hypothetical protein [Spongiibacteraceae bacterium]|tara:strand:+ start:18343 stop:18948 length:606 start_codon:yes stop_codon:yes gene_type:complete